MKIECTKKEWTILQQALLQHFDGYSLEGYHNIETFDARFGTEQRLIIRGKWMKDCDED